MWCQVTGLDESIERVNVALAENGRP